MACVGVILNPPRELFASVACASVSNSTNAISLRPGTKRTSLNPGNLEEKKWITIDTQELIQRGGFTSGFVHKRFLRGPLATLYKGSNFWISTTNGLHLLLE